MDTLLTLHVISHMLSVAHNHRSRSGFLRFSFPRAFTLLCPSGTRQSCTHHPMQLLTPRISRLQTIIKILIEGCKSGFGTPNIIAQVVARVRYSLHILLCRLAVSLSPADRSVPLTPASHPLKSRDPHLSLGHSACELMSKMSPTTAELPSLPFPIDATWFPQAMQHLLVFAVLRRCKLKCLYERPVNGSRMNEIDSFMRASAKRMDEVVELVKKADPLWAKPLLEVMQFAVFASGAALLVKLE